VIGPAEVIGLLGTALILLLVIGSYLYFLVPARLRLSSLESERSLLQVQVRNSEDVVSSGQTTGERVLSITQSLDLFENRLVGANSGRMGLYDSLNSLIRKNGLRNTSGPSYSALEPIGSKNSLGSRSANTKWQSVYPGIAIAVTVEGQYQNLRHFIQDIETSKQFVIINTVELERSTEATGAPVAEGDPAAGSRPTVVSLRLGMSTYFQRGSNVETGIGEGVN
jgi:hypothetical protein